MMARVNFRITTALPWDSVKTFLWSRASPAKTGWNPVILSLRAEVLLGPYIKLNVAY